ncbi:cytochrome P450 [Thelephora ganbajun]|uniref:Cytochrome P450 n=1 Tax=Thelephora ganbajun TaxID=370292 RepID=A0ACB6Z344_THEGA|nr:cytochrome P450 [Thelephora ganbajun]
MFRWLQPLLREWIPASTVATSLTSYLILHKHEPVDFFAVSSLILLPPSVIAWISHAVQSQSSPSLTSIFASYLSLLLGYTIIYRVSPFHPLARYPGPFLARVSKLFMVIVVTKGHAHQYYHRLHGKYGDIVRTGPNELSYCNKDGVVPIHTIPKGPFYARGSNRGISIVFVRDIALHAKQRRAWDKGFNGGALKDYEQLFIKRTQELLENLESRAALGQIVDMSQWMKYFSFDFMGDMVFTHSFDTMKEGDTSGIIKGVGGSLHVLGIVSHLPWATRWLDEFADFIGLGLASINIANVIVDRRIKSGSTSRDLMFHINNEDGKGVIQRTKRQLVAEGLTAMVAGSDTTAIVLSNLWYYLLIHPVYYKRLQQEVDATFLRGEDPTDQDRLAGMEFLNACINETLRLAPPLPSGSQRGVPPTADGKLVGSHLIPGGNNIYLNCYSIHRDSRYFSPEPNRFWPDRWLSQKDRRAMDDSSRPFDPNTPIIHDLGAYLPFSYGTRTCVGKTLAQMELRVVAASVVQKFDMEVADGYDTKQWDRDLQDFYVFKAGPLPVHLIKRQ